MVLPDGRVIRAAADENAELFWALRGGGGGNLGVATRFRLRAARAEPVTVLRLEWREKVEDVFLKLVRALEAAPERMGCKLTIEATRPGNHHPNAMVLLGQLRGTEEEALAILAPALGVAAPASRTVQARRYWEAQRFLGEVGGPARYQETSRYCGTFPERAVEEVFRRCRAWPGTTGEAVFKMFHVGGRIRAVGAGDSAYVHREAEWLTGTELAWTERDGTPAVRANLAWQREFHDATAELMGPGGSYQNFSDPGLRDAAAAYYGANLARLREVKRAVDPTGTFTPPRRQGILPGENA
jgi:FAD/FMN-containing dehydrogenase